MIEGEVKDFYDRIRNSADRIGRSSLRRIPRDTSKESPREDTGRQEVSGVSAYDEENSEPKVTPEILVVSRALRDHGMAHIAGTPADEYDCCAQVAIEAYQHYKRSILRGNSATVYSSLLN